MDHIINFKSRALRVALALANLAVMSADNVFAQSDPRASMDAGSYQENTQQLVNQRRKEEYQSSSPEAKQLTDSIRSKVAEINSNTAKHIVILTDDDNVVTLRGSAASKEERVKIEKCAEEIAGWAYVRSFLQPR